MMMMMMMMMTMMMMMMIARLQLDDLMRGGGGVRLAGSLFPSVSLSPWINMRPALKCIEDHFIIIIVAKQWFANRHDGLLLAKHQHLVTQIIATNHWEVLYKAFLNREAGQSVPDDSWNKLALSWKSEYFCLISTNQRQLMFNIRPVPDLSQSLRFRSRPREQTSDLKKNWI